MNLAAEIDPAAPEVSIVLTTHNEATGVSGTIAALDAQTGLNGFEIIMVDDRSSDDTVAEALAAGSARLEVLRNLPDPSSPLTTRQQALDMGFRAARGRVVLTVDADSSLGPTWAARMAAPVLAGEADAVSGPVGFTPMVAWLGKWQTCDAHQYFLFSKLAARLGAPGGVLFGNFAFRTELYEELGGFRAIGFTLTEDLSFGRAIHGAGGRIRFDGDGTRVDVRACPDFRALVTRTLRISAGRFSVLTLMITLWGATFLALPLAALIFGGAGLWTLAALRYLCGAAVNAYAVRRHENTDLRRFALVYEPLVFVLAGAVLVRLARRDRVGWGGQSYDR